MSSISFESGSFRDREGRVFYDGTRVCRALSRRAAEEWRAVSGKPFFERLLAEKKIIGTSESDVAAPPQGEWAAVLEHERVPFISYPYEWTFSMLKDAALLHLEILLAAIEDGCILKDATPYNIQWFGSRPVFIDVSSFEILQPGEPWIGYRQFCEMFLYPLLLQCYRDVPFQAWLRGSIDGISAENCSRLMSGTDYLRAGVLKDVVLHAKLQNRYADSAGDVKGGLQDAGFSAELIRHNLKRLHKIVSGLEWRRTSSTWADYASSHSYSGPDQGAKEEFVRSFARARHRETVWDLGCNTGSYSRIAAETADYVLAIDADALAVDLLYRQLRSEKQEGLLPLTMNLTDPSPGLGWRGAERQTIIERSKPDLVLALALIHHLVIGANVPLPEVVSWLASLDSDLVIEFVSREDAMVRKLLKNKRDNYDDYSKEELEKSLTTHFKIENSITLESGTRTIYACRRSV
ncbi:MAG TPA: methyltransferase [Thermoanaerobaculia bacterium]|nr:methyltransferase [Thermoanaerobaculia bacterium]